MLQMILGTFSAKRLQYGFAVFYCEMVCEANVFIPDTAAPANWP